MSSQTACLRSHSAAVTEMMQINQHRSTFDCHIYLQYLFEKKKLLCATQAKGFRGMEVQLSLVKQHLQARLNFRGKICTKSKTINMNLFVQLLIVFIIITIINVTDL